MAFRGRKPTATVIRLMTGNPQKRPINEDEPKPDGLPEKPKKLSRRESALWDQYIAAATWLTAVDSFSCVMWVKMAAEFERGPEKMVAGRIAQLRALANELGLNPSARTRLTADGGGKRSDEDKAAAFFTRG